MSFSPKECVCFRDRVNLTLLFSHQTKTIKNRSMRHVIMIKQQTFLILLKTCALWGKRKTNREKERDEKNSLLVVGKMLNTRRLHRQTVEHAACLRRQKVVHTEFVYG